MNQRKRAALANRYQSDGMVAATPQKLLLAVFDRLEQDLATAVGAIESGTVEASHRALLHAQDLVHELNLALDLDAWPAANELRSLYEHLIELLIEANLHKSVDVVGRCQDIVAPLAHSWHEAHRALQEQRMAEAR